MCILSASMWSMFCECSIWNISMTGSWLPATVHGENPKYQSNLHLQVFQVKIRKSIQKQWYKWFWLIELYLQHLSQVLNTKWPFKCIQVKSPCHYNKIIFTSAALFIFIIVFFTLKANVENIPSLFESSLLPVSLLQSERAPFFFTEVTGQDSARRGCDRNQEKSLKSQNVKKSKWKWKCRFQVTSDNKDIAKMLNSVKRVCDWNLK